MFPGHGEGRAILSFSQMSKPKHLEVKWCFFQGRVTGVLLSQAPVWNLEPAKLSPCFSVWAWTLYPNKIKDLETPWEDKSKDTPQVKLVQIRKRLGVLAPHEISQLQLRQLHLYGTHHWKKPKKPLDGSMWTLTGRKDAALDFEYLGTAMVKALARILHRNSPSKNNEFEDPGDCGLQPKAGWPCLGSVRSSISRSQPNLHIRIIWHSHCTWSGVGAQALICFFLKAPPKFQCASSADCLCWMEAVCPWILRTQSKQHSVSSFRMLQARGRPLKLQKWLRH